MFTVNDFPHDKLLNNIYAGPELDFKKRNLNAFFFEVIANILSWTFIILTNWMFAIELRSFMCLLGISFKKKKIFSLPFLSATFLLLLIFSIYLVA